MSSGECVVGQGQTVKGWSDPEQPTDGTPSSGVGTRTQQSTGPDDITEVIPGSLTSRVHHLHSYVVGRVENASRPGAAHLEHWNADRSLIVPQSRHTALTFEFGILRVNHT